MRPLLRGHGARQSGQQGLHDGGGTAATTPGAAGVWASLGLLVHGAEEPLGEGAQLGGGRLRLLLQPPVVLPQVPHLRLQGRLVLLLLRADRASLHGAPAGALPPALLACVCLEGRRGLGSSDVTSLLLPLPKGVGDRVTRPLRVPLRSRRESGSCCAGRALVPVQFPSPPNREASRRLEHTPGTHRAERPHHTRAACPSQLILRRARRPFCPLPRSRHSTFPE